MKPELIFYGGQRLTEAPLYDEKNNCLYFVAIRYNTIFRIDLTGQSVSSFVTDGPVGGTAFDRSGALLEAEKNGIYRINFDQGTKEKIAHIITYDKMRYNHLTVDSRNRILVDVMGDEDRCESKGGLYSIDGDTVRCLEYGTTVANGLDFSPDGSKLFFTDTAAQKVWCYAYDQVNGTVSGRQDVITYEGRAKPDGICMGQNGYLYVTLWAGSRIDIINARTFRKEEEIIFPMQHITACCMDENKRTLYVTTAKSDQPYEVCYAGGVFKVKLC